MMKQLLAAAVAAAVVVPAASAATNNVVVYGKVDMALTKFDRETGLDDWRIHENGGATKLGFKGTEDLGNGLKAIWKMEFDVPIGRGNNPVSGGGPVNSTRNAYIGLAGDWGTALMGRHDTPYKMAFGKWDLFADTIADFNNANTVNFDDLRAQDGVAYVSPNMNGLSIAAAFVTGSGSENTNAATIGSTAEDLVEHYSVAVNYTNNGILAALAYEVFDEATIAPLGATEDDSKIGAALGYNGNGFFAGVRYEYQQDDRNNNFGDTERYMVAASYDFGNNTIKGTYGLEDADMAAATDREQDFWAVGLDHNFSKRTKAYVLYTDFDSDGTGGDLDAFSLGMSHSF